MAKSRGVDVKLNRLKLLRHDAMSPAVVAELRQALGDASNLVAAEAATIIGERVVADFASELVAAFDRFMIDPATSDKNCRALTALVEALNKIDYDQPEVFLRGIRHFQGAAVFGEPEDAAARLRGSSALGLVRINHSGVLDLLADLLADEAHIARLGAVQALGASGDPAAVPLLRFKARAGDDDPAVTSECLSALVSLEPTQSLSFVAEFLDEGEPEVREGAALALGESRRPEALVLLQQFWPRARHSEAAEATLLAMALTRLPAALDFLLAIIAGDEAKPAQAALAALAIHRHNDALRERVAEAVAKRADAALTARFRAKFGADKSLTSE